MAIPFYYEIDEETEDIYRSIDQLIRDLYEIWRLLRRQTVNVNQRIFHGLRDETEQNTVQQQREQQQLTVNNTNPLPDVVIPSTRKPPVPPPRRRRRRSHNTNSGKAMIPLQNTSRTIQQQANGENQPSVSRGWLNVGIELRQIAEEVTIQTQSEDGMGKKRRQKMKALSLFSLLVPAPITGSIWTAVFILVGWKMLIARQR